jgi:hypothetical protein
MDLHDLRLKVTEIPLDLSGVESATARSSTMAWGTGRFGEWVILDIR